MFKRGVGDAAEVGRYGGGLRSVKEGTTEVWRILQRCKGCCSVAGVVEEVWEMLQM